MWLFHRLKLEAASRRCGARARDGTHGLQAHGLVGLEDWENEADGETAGTDAADSHFVVEARSGCGYVRCAGLGGGGRAGVLQDCRVQAVLQVGVGPRTLVYGVPTLEERGDVDLLGREQVEESFHVAPFSPADISNGVIHPPFLILRIIPARPVRPRESQ